MLYVRQSSAFQVLHNQESQKLQYAMQTRLRDLGFTDIEVIDEDLGRCAAGTQARSGFCAHGWRKSAWDVSARSPRKRGVSQALQGKVAVEWQQLLEVCRVVDTVVID